MICARSPASIANLGPGFDVVAVALEGPFDVVCLDLREEPGLRVEVIGPHASLVPPQASENVIHPVLTGAAEIAGYEGGFIASIWKGIRPASGLGSSGADAAASAYLAARLLGLDLTDWELARLAALGEVKAAGSPHLDNVSASLFGGLVLINEELERIDKMDLWPFPIVVVTMGSKPSTSYMRGLLPDKVDIRSAVGNLAGLASLIHAAHVKDVGLLGRAAGIDHLAAPHRIKAYPHFTVARNALLRHGAVGVGLSGAGPSIFGIFKEEPCLECIRNEVEGADVFLTHPSNSGTSLIDKLIIDNDFSKQWEAQ